jgi:hypothetical protein
MLALGHAMSCVSIDQDSGLAEILAWVGSALRASPAAEATNALDCGLCTKALGHIV